MKIEIDINPDDLANIIVDTKFTLCKSKGLLLQILNSVKKNISINMEELEALQLISDESEESEETENFGA